MKKSDLIFTSILVPVDFIMLLFAGLGAYFLRVSSYISQYWPVLFALNLPFSRYFAIIIFVSIFLLFVFALIGLYQMKSYRRFLDDFPKILVGVSAGIMSLVLYIFLRREWFDSRFLILAGWIFAVFFVSLGRVLMSQIQKLLMANFGYGLQKVLIVGNDDLTEKLVEIIKKKPRLGYKLMVKMKELDLGEVRKKAKEFNIDSIILANPSWPKDKLLKLVNFCEQKHIGFKFIPNLFQTLTKNSVFESLLGIPMVEIKRVRLDGWWRIIKRLFDIIFSFFFIIIFSPVYLLIALIIKFESPGPIIYKDYRHGYKNKKFVFYKFRSMKSDLCDGEFGTKEGNKVLEKLEKDASKNSRKGSPLHKIKKDPRRTKIGNLIRKSSLDELPQFFSVLKGDMSVVGYRPHMSKEVANYTEGQKKMFCAKPGITGLAQISGRSGLNFDEEVKLDLFYIENWSFLLDLIIILKTPFILLFRRHEE